MKNKIDKQFGSLLLLALIFVCQFDALAQGDDVKCLDNEYSNEYFSVRYPSSWLLVDSYDTTRLICGATLFSKKQSNYITNYIILSVEKGKDENCTTDTAQSIWDLVTFKPLEERSLRFSGCDATLLGYSVKVVGHKLIGEQYTIKKDDDTIYRVTVTCEKKRYKKVQNEVSAIVNSIEIK